MRSVKHFHCEFVLCKEDPYDQQRQRAEILVQALPYIQQYTGQVVVVKYGGNAMTSDELKHAVMRDIVLLSLVGVRVVLVHGGGPEITEMLEKIGKESRFVGGLRVTDAETAQVVQMVLSGKINKGLVNLLGSIGGRAIGLCGMDGGMIQARPPARGPGLCGRDRAHRRAPDTGRA